MADFGQGLLTTNPSTPIKSYGTISHPSPHCLTSDDTTSTVPFDGTSQQSSTALSRVDTLRKGRPISFIVPVQGHADSYQPTLLNRTSLFFNQTICNAFSFVLLLLVVFWAVFIELASSVPSCLCRGDSSRYPWDDPKRWKHEKNIKDVRYYAKEVGLDVSEEVVETDDGFFLRMHRVVNPRHIPQTNGKGGLPVLILHGLFQSSGVFMTSEEHSLPFWLSQKGYQVFLGNTRGVFDMGHRTLSRSDPRFWDWTIRELALYDFPALIEYVRDATGYDKIAFIGHSQGNALAPAVYAGPLTHGFPFTILSRLRWDQWKRIFGVLDFLPVMRYAYNLAPARPFALLGYVMFAYLFSWTDANWLKRRKTKMFRFTPTPVSSASIFWWCGYGGFAHRKCTMDDSLLEWYGAGFPPLAIYYGGRDFLVSAEPLIERIRNRERHVQVVRTKRINGSEHCDFYLAAEAVEWCFTSIVQDIESTRQGPAAHGGNAQT